MSRVSDELIEQIRSHFDIVDVVSEYVTVRRSGRDYMGLCPFHSEKSPSFSVSRDKQFYYCFGCGEGGSVLTFVMKMEGLSFGETLEHLAKRSGIPIPTQDELETDSEEQRERTELLRMYELSSKFYHHLLMNHESGRNARNYLLERKIEYSTMTQFMLGYAPPHGDALVSLLLRRGFSKSLIEKSGLVSGSNTFKDKFRDRVMFPIQDGQGRVIAFGGRILKSGEPKYLNSPETLLFHKGQQLFNLHRARPNIRKLNQVILLEGYLDVIAVSQSGILNVVAALGTGLSPDQARLLNRNAEELILIYDGDQAGQRAATRSIDVIREAGGRAKIVTLPNGLDPDEFIREKGSEAFKRMITNGAISDTRFRVQRLREASQFTTPEGRADFLEQAVSEIGRAGSEIEHETYLKELAGEFQVSLESLRNELATRKQVQKQTNERKNLAHSAKHKSAPYKRMDSAIPETDLLHERRLLISMLLDSGVTKQVLNDLGDGFQLDSHAALAACLYSFYSEHQQANPSLFLSQLGDEHLRNLASHLLLEAVEVHEKQMELVQESLLYLKNYKPLQQRKLQLPLLMQQAHNEGNYELLQTLQAELIQLNRDV